jgi:hypothetical protein
MSSGNTGRVIRIRLRSPLNLGKKSSNLWFNRRSKEGQEDDNVQLSANMLIISGNGNGGKRDNNAGSAEKGDGNTERTTTIPKDEVSTSNVTESDGMTDSDRWGAAVKTEHKRLVCPIHLADPRTSIR